MLVMYFGVDFSYSQDKPSEDVMKTYILTKYFRNPSSKDTNVRYNSFQTTHSFFKKGSDGMDYYHVEVNYKILYTIPNYEGTGKPKDDTIIGKDEKFIFTKKGDGWYGHKGWE